ncbi:SDR family NAD(P)-dependent oxidoreductase [Actinomadura sp. 21ATH]|uniref:SDR family NAD(P)-dependent oxidoreductase n=1 Tax=Actinomadura sp. 21ATH TaxID=1735444 RepID=UPI0035C1D57B
MSGSFQTAVVTGAGRGFGRAIAAALAAAGTGVVGIARSEHDLRAIRGELGEGFTPLAADAADETLARDVLREHRPGLLVLNAGATPHMAPLHEQTWETFSRHWHTDARHARCRRGTPSVAVRCASAASTEPTPMGGHGRAGIGPADHGHVLRVRGRLPGWCGWWRVLLGSCAGAGRRVGCRRR